MIELSAESPQPKTKLKPKPIPKPRPKPIPPRDMPLSPGGHQIHCPNCQRYIGPMSTCPYCHFKIPKKASYKTLKYGVLIWGIVGVLLLQQIYSNMPNPEMRIEDLGPENNYGRIVITGTITRSLNYYESETRAYGTLYMNVDDGTGEMQVISYDETTEWLVEQGKVPAFGDRVRIEGTYQYKDYRFYMILDAAEHIDIMRDEPEVVTAAFIDDSLENAELMGERVTVEGYVSSWSQFDWALSMWITDYQGNEVNVYVPSAVW